MQNDSFFLWNIRFGFFLASLRKKGESSIIRSHKHVTGVKESDYQKRQVTEIMTHLGVTLHGIFSPVAARWNSALSLKNPYDAPPKNGSIISSSALFNQADLLLCI